MNNLNEIIYQTIEKIVDSKLNGNDTIKICTITNVNNKNNGQYIVTDGFAEFIAYSDNLQQEYKIGDLVRVSVIKGEFQYTNYILGRYQANLNKNPQFYYYIKELKNIQATHNAFRPEPYLLPENCNTLQVKFDVKHQGNEEFGIKISMINSYFPNKTILFTNKNMYGNPKAFKVYTPQNFVYEIPSYYCNVNGKDMYTEIAVQTIPNSSAEYKNIQITFGQNPYRNFSIVNLGANSLQAIWENKDGIGEEIGFSDGLGVIDEEEYQEFYEQEISYQNFLNEQFNSTLEPYEIIEIPKDKNTYAIIKKIKQVKEELVPKICQIYTKIIERINKENYVALVNTLLEKLLEKLCGYYYSNWNETNNRFYWYLNGYNNTIDGMINFYLYNLNKVFLNEVQGIAPKIVTIENLESAINTNSSYKSNLLDQAIPKLIGDIDQYLRKMSEEIGEQSITSQQKYESDIFPLLNDLIKISQDYQNIIGAAQSETIDDESVDIYMSDIHEKLTRYWEIENYDPNSSYKTIDFSFYDNKYCLYWFGYKKGAYDNDAGTNWEYINNSWNKSIPTELGMDGRLVQQTKKDKYILPDGHGYNKIKAILYYNHVPYTAEILL